MPALSSAIPPLSEVEIESDRLPTDQSLLSAWREGGRAEDFTELVRRHFHLVRGIARRQLGEDLAEDTAQTVFTILARKAPDARCLAAWLHRVTVLQCRDAVRRKMREKRARSAAMEIANLTEARDPLADALPHIDDAIAGLDDRDRELLLLRYSEGLSFTAAAARTGRAEAALRQQAGRALEKLSRALRRRGVSVPAVTLASGLGGVLGSPPAAQAATVAATAVAGAGALTGLSLLSITLATMTTAQSLAAGTLAAALLSAIPLGWQTHQLNQRATAAARSSDAASISSAPASPKSTDASSPQTAGTPKPVELPSDDVMEELGKEMEGEMMEVMRNWAMSAAWTESRGLAMALGLSPERESALRAALEEYQGNRVAGVMDGGTKAGTERRKFKEQRDTWLAENLSPEEFTKLKALDASQRENMIASKAEEALHWITSKVELTEDQKTKLFNTAAERAGADFDKDEYGGMMQFTGWFQSTPAPPVEDAAADFVAGVLDAEQQQLWGESASRMKYATEDMPRRLVDSAFEIVKRRGLLGVMAAMMKEITPPAAPTAEPKEAP